MKKIVLILGLALTVFSCDKAKDTIASVTEATKGGDKIDYMLFTNEAESKKWYDAVVEKMGAVNAKVCDEVRFSISRPSVEGMIKKQGDPDKLYVNIVYQDPADKRRVEEISYYSETGWRAPEKKEIQVMGGSAEDFKLEDELFNFSEVTFDIFNKVLKDAWAKYADSEKYEYQYIDHIKITKSGINVDIKGKLKSNAQEKSEYYRTNLKGDPKK